MSVGFFKQDNWSGWPFPSPGHIPDPGIKPMRLRSHVLAGRFFSTSATGEALVKSRLSYIQ